jgi:hypothetical protein
LRVEGIKQRVSGIQVKGLGIGNVGSGFRFWSSGIRGLPPPLPPGLLRPPLSPPPKSNVECALMALIL